MSNHVVLGVTGSIAAYKAIELVRLIKTKGWDISVVMTRAATEFVGELTFRTLSGKPVSVDMFGRPSHCEPQHVSLADSADVLLIAPCTANVMAKISHGIADDLLTCTVLASRAPLIVAPAMNGKMWDHPATRANLNTLRSREVHVLDVESGYLACGYDGRGRMASTDAVIRAVESTLDAARTANGDDTG